MANPEHLAILSQGAETWNAWRQANPNIYPDLSDSYIPAVLIKHSGPPTKRGIIKKSRIDPVQQKNSRKIIVDFTNVNFFKSRLEAAYFPYCNFENANFYEADLSRAILHGANLRNCNFRKTYMAYADLSNTVIVNANLNRASLIKSNVCGARIENCIVYGTAAWGLSTDKDTIQQNLMIEDTNGTGDGLLESIMGSAGHYPLMVDDIEVAQFIHFITNYSNLGKGLTAMLERGVLLLGKFKEGGRATLEFVAGEIRKKQLIPIIFDFDVPKGSNLIETVTVLAGISRFVLANLNGSSVPAELTRITANFKRPIITYSSSNDEKQVFAMFDDLLALDNVLYFKYKDEAELSRKIEIKLAEAEKSFAAAQQNQVKKVQDKRNNG